MGKLASILLASYMDGKVKICLYDGPTLFSNEATL